MLKSHLLYFSGLQRHKNGDAVERLFEALHNRSIVPKSPETLDILNPFVYCSKTRPSIGKASSASQQPNSRQNDKCCKCRFQNDRLKKLRQQAG